MTTLLVHLHHHDIPFLLIGGRGLEAHGYVRNTRDLDLLLPLEVLKRIPQILSDFGYVRTAETAIFSRWISADPATEDLDLLYVDASTFAKLDADAVAVDFGETNAIDLVSLRRLCERYGPPDIFDALHPSS